MRGRVSTAAVLLMAALGLACMSRESGAEAPAAEVAPIQRKEIEHVTPKRDFVGRAPAKLEWTAAEGVDSYDITVSTEIDSLVFEYVGARTTFIEWPEEIKLEPGTYFWRVVGLKDGRGIADSGRAAFVVTN